MLHVTNGSVAVDRLHDLDLPGRFLPWDDVLHEGPVPAGLSDDELRGRRAAFLAINWGDVGDIEQMLAARDRALLDGIGGDEIVLWFEHDLYDQLHVLQIVDQLRAIRPGLGGGAARVSAILADDYLAAQSDEQLQAWFETRQPLGASRWSAAVEAWRLFRAPDPRPLCGFEHPGTWPSLARALRRHLQQFPSVATGLSRTQAQTLAAVADRPRPVRDVFRAANHEVEDAVFMGDMPWWWHVRPLLAAPHPLLRVEGDRPADPHDPDWWRDDEGAPRLALTDTGARVAAGDADHITLNGIDRWLGGVHLVAEASGVQSGGAIWRWDEPRGAVVHG
ncbi:MAG: hypothetical protein IT180_15740 [Acidobacteria bacterium]|nr:hypothetical protein [Acidobacteriota bacterium]